MNRTREKLVERNLLQANTHFIRSGDVEHSNVLIHFMIGSVQSRSSSSCKVETDRAKYVGPCSQVIRAKETPGLFIPILPSKAMVPNA